MDRTVCPGSNPGKATYFIYFNMKKYIEPKIGIVKVPEIMCICGCGSYCPQDCKCHNSHWPGHNPHGCNCSDGHGHGHHPDLEDYYDD